MRRNQRGDDRLYVSVKHSAFTSLSDLYQMGMDDENEVCPLKLKCKVNINLLQLFFS